MNTETIEFKFDIGQDVWTFDRRRMLVQCQTIQSKNVGIYKTFEGAIQYLIVYAMLSGEEYAESEVFMTNLAASDAVLKHANRGK